MGTTKMYVTYNYCWTVTKNKLILNEGGGFLVSQKCSVFLKNKNPPGGLVEKNNNISTWDGSCISKTKLVRL